MQLCFQRRRGRAAWLQLACLGIFALGMLPGMAMAALSVQIKAIPPINTTNAAGIVSGASDSSAPRYGSVQYQITLTSTTAVGFGGNKTVTVSIPAGITINPGVRTHDVNFSSCSPNATVVGPATLTCTTTQALSAGVAIPLANFSGVKTGTGSITTSVSVTAGDAACTGATPPATCSASNTVSDSTPSGNTSLQCPSTPLVSSGSFSSASVPVASGWYNSSSAGFATGTAVYNYDSQNTSQNSDATSGLFPIANPTDANSISGLRSALQEHDGAVGAVVYTFPQPLTAGVTYQLTSDLSNRFPETTFADYYRISLYNVATNTRTVLFNGPADLMPWANGSNWGWSTFSDTFTVPTTGTYRLLFQIDQNPATQNSDYMIDRVAVCAYQALPPTLTLNKTTTGVAGGAFGFTLTNTMQASGSITTTAADTPTQVDGDTATAGTQAFTVVSAGSDVTINESTLPAGWTLSGATCTNAANASVGSLSGSTYTIPAAEVAATTALNCTFTNALQPADLSVTKTNTPGVNGEQDQASDTLVSGATTTYTITVNNAGPGGANGAVLADPATAGLTCSTASCSAAGGASCPSQTGADLVTALQDAGAIIPALPNGGSITVQLACEVN